MTIRAVVFEDDDHVRNMLGRALSRRGYEVLSYPSPRNFCASGSNACLCGSGEACADFVISDVMMPWETGIDFVRRQKVKGCHVGHVALLSGYWTRPALDAALQLGCKIFEKPLSIDVLAKWLDRCENDMDKTRTLRDFYCQPAALPVTPPPPPSSHFVHLLNGHPSALCRV